jgi:tellurite resistance protein TehA-like permease
MYSHTTSNPIVFPCVQPKTDDMTREDFDIVRHTKVAHFGMHLGLAGLAVAWQVAADVLPSCSMTVSYVLALIAAALYVLWLGLYTFRAFDYERKVG